MVIQVDIEDELLAELAACFDVEVTQAEQVTQALRDWVRLQAARRLIETGGIASLIA